MLAGPMKLAEPARAGLGRLGFKSSCECGRAGLKASHAHYLSRIHRDMPTTWAGSLSLNAV